MKISELINTLVELSKKHGDIEVRAYGPDEDEHEGPLNSIVHFNAVSEFTQEWPEHIELSHDVDLF